MYHGGEKKKKINPKENAGIISRITFFFTCDLLRRGYKKDIEEDDIYEVLPKLKSSEVGDELEKQWKIENIKSSEPSIFRLLWACYGKYYLFWGFIQLFVKTAVVLIQPRALGKLISYFTTQSKMSKLDAIYYAVLVISLNIIVCTYSHNYQLILAELGIKVKTAFCSLLYRKSLKLSPSSLSDITIGKIVTLISKDILIFDSAIIFLNDVWISVIHLMITTYLIYSRLGVATFAGIGFLVLIIPLQLFVGRLTSKFRTRANKVTDERVLITQETISAIRIVKMYTWEKFFSMKISKIRQQEVEKIKQIYYAKAVPLVIGGLVLNITLYLIVVTYTGLGQVLTAETAFFLLSCLQTLRSSVTISIPLGISHGAELVASARRIRRVLMAKELKKPKRKSDFTLKPMVSLKDVSVQIKDKIILQGIDLKIDQGLNIITGKLGGGKSSLLKTIMEVYPVTGGHLLVHGKISYASEEPWLFPSTIKQNILFGQELDEERYRKTLQLCALNQDVNTFENGDNSIVDDRGMNLSKGQQARINLARAVYKNSDIYLLDDCLSSLDAHVQEFVFRECIKKFLKDKIVIMISHDKRHVQEADNVIWMENATVKSVAKPSEIPEEEITEIIRDEDEEERHPDLIDNIEIEDENEVDEKTQLVQSEPRDNIYHEEKKEGAVDINIYKQYCRFAGGALSLTFVLILFILAQGGSSFSEKLVSSWVNVQQNISDYKVNNLTNTTKYQKLVSRNTKVLTTYSVMIAVATLLILVRAYALFNFCSKASINIHQNMISAVINATMQFFDLHYVGNILNRFSKDLGTIDEFLPFVTYEVLRLICTLSGIIILIATVNVSFLIPAAIIFVFLYFIRRCYLPTGRSLKRLDSATRSPVVGHLNASLEGLPTIRAFGTQKILEREFDKNVDLHISTFHMMQCASRAFAYSLDMLCNFFIAVIIARFLIFPKDTLPGNVGLAITQAFMLTGLLQWGIKQWAELENYMTSVERVMEYNNVKEENRTGQTLQNWPERGKITYESIYLTYGKSKEYVLKNINFTINSGEKIGIVGRTGAGKSSITSILFRLYRYEGMVTIDNVDIKTLSLDFLRSKIAIIPQDPILFSGTIRSNIDPTSIYSDEEIWNAVEIVKLKELIKDLDDEITESGSNFSAGQKQLICLARALVSNSKIIILDEATATMDPETDTLLHSTIQENFASCTVITIAHRLHTVLHSDRVMVVDKGEVVEFSDPNELLTNTDGVFYKMAKQANLLK